METIKLDLIPSGKMPSLHASQYDDGREHGIDLFENGIAYKLDGTETLTINERKGDDCICSLDIENTFADSNHIVFASTEQMCAVWGNNICELVITKGEKTIGTLNFILEIEPSPTEGGIESESEISNLERQITEITEQVIGDDYYTAEQTDEAIATAIEGKADTTYVNNALANKMDKANPTGTGSFSLNRKADSTIGTRSFAEGYNNTASGNASHAEGRNTTASGNYSHSEGYQTTASESDSHAEGYQTTASGFYSHSEGYQAIASGSTSHAEGNKSEASGINSHAEGSLTIANHKAQHVFGEFNVADDSTASELNRGNYIEIVGNGTSSNARSNARTLDWNGNETLAGDLTFNGNKSLTSEISRLDGRITDLPEPMVLKGTLGVGGTIETLPTASASNEGWTFKCITAGTYEGLTLKVGDTVTCFNPPNTSTYYWDKTGSQDTDTDTWRAIKVNGVEKLGNGISSGSLDVVDTDNIEAEFDNDGNKLKIKTKNIYTQAQVDAIVSDAIYNVLPDDTASGSVANFNTSLALPLKSLEADINAVQDLHGYDAPWIGGAGKNKCKPLDNPVTRSSGITVTPQADGSVILNGTQSGNGGTVITAECYIKQGVTYIASIGNYDTNIIDFGIQGFGHVKKVTHSSDFNSYGVQVYITEGTTLNNVRLYPQIEEGSTATDFAPYENICPITGHDEVNIYHSGADTSKPDEITIALGQTVYGGKLDVKSGLLRVLYALFTPTSTMTIAGPYRNNYNCWVVTIVNSPTIFKVNGRALSNVNTPAKYTQIRVSGFCNIINNRAVFSLADSDSGLNASSTLSDIQTAFVTFVSTYSPYAVYELATPIEVQLTPQEIEAFIGTNNIYADTGDTSVVFKDSVNGYVEKKIASVQALALNT